MLDTNKTDAVLRASEVMSKEWLQTQKDAKGVRTHPKTLLRRQKDRGLLRALS